MRAPGRILVINPNSNAEVTEAFSQALAPFRVAGGPEIECVTLAEGPIGIETQEHVEQVVLPLLALMRRRDDADAYVIACYSDPGLAACREAVAKPVFGIQECAVLAAMSLGERVGILALGPASVRRHLRYLRQMGVLDRIAGERPLNLSVAEAEAAAAYPRVLDVGRELREADGADVLILGCAGMAQHRAPLEQDLGAPVVDPVQAATGAALAAVLLAAPARGAEPTTATAG